MTTTGTGQLSQAQILIACTDLEELFLGTDGETTYASVTVDGHRETYRVGSRAHAFRRWLVGKFYEVEQRPPSSQALTDALGVIEARARYGGSVRDVHVRLAEHSGAIYLDLADPTWRVVEITARGWHVVDRAPVRFRRARGMLALPEPARGSTLDELRAFVNVRDDAQYALLAAWLVAAARPRGPYPVLALGGEHGSAKSTTAEALRRLIDPNAAMLRAEPRDVRDVMIAASNGWVVALDNLSSLEAWLSDALCRLATGGGFATRQLHTDADEIIFDAQRPVALTGIEDVITRSDLLDRALLLDLPAIAETRRRPALEFWSEFDAARPRLLGALLDTVSVSLAREATVKLPRLPRMADFAIVVTAAAPALGWSDGYFLGVYTANRSTAHEVALDASPIAAAVRRLAEDGPWAGTATELLAELNKRADAAMKPPSDWPARARDLGAGLRRIAPNLRHVGVEVQFADRPELGARRRQIAIQKTDVPDRSQRSQRSEPPEERSDAEIQHALSFPENDGGPAGNAAPAAGNAGNAAGNAGNAANAGNPALSVSHEVPRRSHLPTPDWP